MRGYLLAAAAGILWGLISLFGKLLVGYQTDPTAVVAIRAVLAFVSLGSILLIVRPQLLHISWADVPFFLAFGLFGVAASYATYILALKYTTVTVAITIGYTYPALVSILAAIFLAEPLNRTKVVALVLALFGSFFVVDGFKVSGVQMNSKGILFSVGTSVALALYSILAKRALPRYGPWTLAVYGFGFGALWLLIIASPQAILSTHLPVKGWMLLVAWAWIPTVLAYSLYLMALRSIEASKATIICTLEPVSAIVLACLFLGERVAVWQLMGAALVLGGVISVARSAHAGHGAETAIQSVDGRMCENELNMKRRYSDVN